VKSKGKSPNNSKVISTRVSNTCSVVLNLLSNMSFQTTRSMNLGSIKSESYRELSTIKSNWLVVVCAKTFPVTKSLLLTYFFSFLLLLFFLLKNKKVEPVNKSLNKHDVFVLDVGERIFQWNGSGATNKDRAKGLHVSTLIKNCERAGFAKRVVIGKLKFVVKEIMSPLLSFLLKRSSFRGWR
jgi:hypothetical protein